MTSLTIPLKKNIKSYLASIITALLLLCIGFIASNPYHLMLCTTIPILILFLLHRYMRYILFPKKNSLGIIICFDRSGVTLIKKDIWERKQFGLCDIQRISYNQDTLSLQLKNYHNAIHTVELMCKNPLRWAEKIQTLEKNLGRTIDIHKTSLTK